MLRHIRQHSRASIAAVPIPTGGWDALSPVAEMKPQFARTLDNWFPRPGYLELRRGFDLHASPGGPTVSTAVETLMAYQGPSASALFAAMDDTLYDVTTAGTATAITDVGSFGNARFQAVNFATSGGHFLWACNGDDAPVYYDGSSWAATSITGVTDTDIVHVAVHRGRLWLVLKDSLDAAYLPLDSIQGAAVKFPLGGEFTLGGHLVAIDTWSRDGGAGPDDYLCFISSRGQVAIYSVIDPTESGGITLIGVYNLGPPIGRRCTARIGPDLAVIAIDGVYSLSQAITFDRAASARATITTRVQPAINETARLASDTFGWQFISYPKGQMAILNVPQAVGSKIHQYAMNVLTGAWARFTGQNANCWAVMDDRLFFGGAGLVLEADVGGGDFGGESFVADVGFPYSYYGARGHKKRWTMAQPIFRTNASVTPAMGIDVDFRDGGSLNPVPSGSAGGAEWNEFNWNEENWPGEASISDQWLSVMALGYAAAAHLQVAVAGKPLGEELALNRSFADWTSDDPDEWTVVGESGSNVVTEASPGAQIVSDDGTQVGITLDVLTAGRRYRMTLVVSDVSGGAIQFGTGTDLSDDIDAAGTYTVDVTAGSGDGTKISILTANAAAADVTVTSISVKEILVEGEGGSSSITLELMAMNVAYEVGGAI